MNIRKVVAGTLLSLAMISILYTPLRREAYARIRFGGGYLRCTLMNERNEDPETDRLEKAYKMDIQGGMPPDIGSAFFSYVNPNTLKDTTICFAPVGETNYFGTYSRMPWPDDHILVNTDKSSTSQNTFHELTHVATHRAGKEFKKEWLAVMKKYNRRYGYGARTSRFGIYHHDWIKPSPITSFRYGFASPYASRNFIEDVAVLAERIYAESTAITPLMDTKPWCQLTEYLFGAPRIIEDHDIYIEKALLLKKYKMISPAKVDGFIRHIENSETYRRRKDKLFRITLDALEGPMSNFDECTRKANGDLPMIDKCCMDLNRSYWLRIDDSPNIGGWF
ncbi:MAG: hypothetical protein ABIA21_01695 [Candidatus Aenigmatarchaeota archaeon]